MQISSGWAKGLRLQTPAGEGTRPTAAKVRAAIANMLQPWLADALVLDLFAGSGALGIEAVSRGARGAVFVESAAPALACLRKNVAELERRAKAQDLRPGPLAVVARDAGQALARLGDHGAFDVLAMDPPYAAAVGWLERLGPGLAGLAAPGALLVVETALADAARLAALDPAALGWALTKSKEYGDTLVTLWERPA